MPCGDPRRWAQRGAAGHIGVPAAQRSGQARAKSQSVKALRLRVRDPTQSRGPHEHPGGTAGRCAHTSSCAAGAWPLSRQQQHLSNPPRLRFLSGPPLCGHHWGGGPPNLEGSRTETLLAARARGAGRSWAGRGAHVFRKRLVMPCTSCTTSPCRTGLGGLLTSSRCLGRHRLAGPASPAPLATAGRGGRAPRPPPSHSAPPTRGTRVTRNADVCPALF